MLVRIFEITFNPKLLHFYLSCFGFQFFQNVWRAYFIAKKKKNVFSWGSHSYFWKYWHSLLIKQVRMSFLPNRGKWSKYWMQIDPLLVFDRSWLQVACLSLGLYRSSQWESENHQLSDSEGVRRLRTKVQKGKSSAVNTESWRREKLRGWKDKWRALVFWHQTQKQKRTKAHPAALVIKSSWDTKGL